MKSRLNHKTEVVRLNVTVPTDLYAHLMTLADAERRSITGQVLYLLEQSIGRASAPAMPVVLEGVAK